MLLPIVFLMEIQLYVLVIKKDVISTAKFAKKKHTFIKTGIRQKSISLL